MSESDSTKTMNRRITWLLLLVNLSVPAFVFFQRNDDNLSDTANIWVGWISATFMTAVLLISMRRRLPPAGRPIPASVMLISIALVILSGVITTVAISTHPSDNYLQVALSDTPLNEVRPERKRLLVELIRKDKAASDENGRFYKTMKPISPVLYSVDSFASGAVMESVSSQLKQAYAGDIRYAAAKSQALKDFHDRMLKVDPACLEDFDAKLQRNNVSEDALEATEAKWATSTLNLYAYAIAHANQISMSKTGHLVFANEAVRQDILQQLDTCRTLEQTMSNQREKAVDDQHSVQDAMGTRHSD